MLLHIGQPKTGTSAIQAFLLANRRELWEAGTLYPSIRINGFTFPLRNHNRVANALNDMPSLYPHLTAEQYFDQFYTEARRADAGRMILSAENFFGVDQWLFFDEPDEQSYLASYKKKLKTLAVLLRDHDVEIIVYLRPQVEWMSSMISHLVRYRVEPMDLSDRQIFELARPQLRYCQLLDLWRNVIRSGSLSAIPYAPDVLREKSSVADFVHRADLNHIDVFRSKKDLRTNTSLSPEYVVLKRSLNQRKKRSVESRFVDKCLLRLSACSNMGGMYRFDDDLVEDIERYVLEDNARLGIAYISPETSFGKKGVTNGGRFVRPTEDEVDKAATNFEKEYHRLGNVFLRIWYLARTIAFKCFPHLSWIIENQVSALGRLCRNRLIRFLN